MEREARFSMFIRINEHLPQRNGQYFFVLTCWCKVVYQLERCLYESVSSFMPVRIICIIAINCSYPTAILTVCWDNIISLQHEIVTVMENWKRKALCSQEKKVGLILILLKSSYYWFQMIWCPPRPSFRSIGPSYKSTFVLQMGLQMFISQYQAI